jgi:acetyl esterase/lipase
LTVDTQIAALLERVNAARPLSAGSPEEGREAFRTLNVLAARLVPRVEVGSVEDVSDGPVPMRIYRPEGERIATLVFIHGGGFVIGDLESYDAQCRILCNRVGVTVVSVDYRLAPEHPFPAGAEDALAAFDWVVEHEPGPIVIGGDSAGGNLSAVTAQARRDSEIAAQLLIYPATDLAGEYPSMEQNGEGLFLTRDDMEWFHQHYLGHDEAARSDPRASPLLAEDLSGLPPALVYTAQYDPLRDAGNAYAEALSAAGVKVVHRCFEGLIHGFFGLGPFSSAAQLAIDQICEDLRGLLVAEAARQAAAPG